MIEIKNISKSFSKQPVLKNLSLKFKNGEISLISGNNGTGKSTLLNIISCVIKPDSGEVYFSNKKIGFYDYKYRNQVGYLLDKPFYLEKLNAVEFLSFLLESYRNFDKNSKKEILFYLNLFQLPSGVLIENFSKGMKKKLSIISALIHNPKFLIMDEPIASLDNNSIELFQSVLLEKKRNNCTIIISSPTKANYIEPDTIIELIPQKPISYE
jgi:ABC-2 type transport system ATP-binding protein